MLEHFALARVLRICYTVQEQSCYRVATSSPKRMEVVLMNNNYFDFKDLMAFGMFILALLTFVLTFCK